MAYTRSTNPVQLTQADRHEVIRQVLATTPAQGRTHTGVIAGLACETAQNQRDAIHAGYRTALARKRRMSALEAAA